MSRPEIHLMDFVDLAIYDEMLPCGFSPFRTLEYGHYLSFFEASILASFEGWHPIHTTEPFSELCSALPYNQEAKSKIVPITEINNVPVRLAYVTFLDNAVRLLPYFNERNIPFILQLYPGGTFSPYDEVGDSRLSSVIHSNLCRKIITTQTLTRDYLLDVMKCDPAKVVFIYGGVYDSRVDFDFYRDKQRYGVAKNTLDLCFVAHRYLDNISIKGYDNFVAIAKELTKQFDRVRFHVVGDYRPDDIPLEAASESFTYYGPQPNSFFADFYPKMDAIISANKPREIGRGAFDGFPTGACMEAGFRGVLTCVTDPLGLNIAFTDNQDILILDRNVSRSVERLVPLLSEPDKLYALAYRNWKAFRKIFDVDAQLWERTKVIASELVRPEYLITRPAGLRTTIDIPPKEAVRHFGNFPLLKERAYLNFYKLKHKDARDYCLSLRIRRRRPFS